MYLWCLLDIVLKLLISTITSVADGQDWCKGEVSFNLEFSVDKVEGH